MEENVSISTLQTFKMNINEKKIVVMIMRTETWGQQIYINEIYMK